MKQTKPSRSQVSPVRKPSVEVTVVGIVPGFQHKAVRVERRQEVNLGAPQKSQHILPLLRPASAKTLSKSKEKFSTDHLVPVDVPHEFHLYNVHRVLSSCPTCGLKRGLGFFTPSVIRKTSNSLPCTLVPIRETWIESEKYDLCVLCFEPRQCRESQSQA